MLQSRTGVIKVWQCRQFSDVHVFCREVRQVLHEKISLSLPLSLSGVTIKTKTKRTLIDTSAISATHACLAEAKLKPNSRAQPNTDLHFLAKDSPFRIGGPAKEKRRKKINTAVGKIDHFGNSLLTENNHSLGAFAEEIELCGRLSLIHI